MYAATSFGCAAYESVFHDIDPAATFKTVPLSKVEELAGSSIEIDRDLKLARLFEPDLNKWGITRQDCDEFGLRSQQLAAQAWAEDRFATQIVEVDAPDVDEEGKPLETTHHVAKAIRHRTAGASAAR